MRAVIQRVTRGCVSVDNRIVGEIAKGLVILLGVRMGDRKEDAIYLAEKCANLRIFSDAKNNLNLSCLDIKGQILVISQFTLYGDTRKGRRPSFLEAAAPELSEPLYEHFVDHLRKLGIEVACGVFGAMMQVWIHNDGPVTLIVESK